MNKYQFLRDNVLDNIFDDEEAGDISNNEPEDAVEINSDCEDEIDGEVLINQNDLVSFENYNSMVRSESVTFENFESLVRSVSFSFLDVEILNSGPILTIEDDFIESESRVSTRSCAKSSNQEINSVERIEILTTKKKARRSKKVTDTNTSSLPPISILKIFSFFI